MAKQQPEEVLTAEKLMQIGKETRKFVLATLPPGARMAGLTIEERLAGLTSEELTQLMQQIEHYLSQQANSGL